MTQVVLPALIPDIPRIYDVYFSAFKNDAMGSLMLNILFPGTIDDDFRKAHAAGTLSYWHVSNCQYTLKVVDTHSGEIIGMGLGDAYLRERTEVERANHGVPWLEGKQRERAEAILNPLWEMREALFGGRRYICKWPNFRATYIESTLLSFRLVFFFPLCGMLQLTIRSCGSPRPLRLSCHCH